MGERVIPSVVKDDIWRFLLRKFEHSDSVRPRMNTAPRTNIGKIFYLLRKIRVRWIHVAVPVALSMFAAMFEGVGIGLLIPILNGFLQKSFAFAVDAPVIGRVLRLLPDAVLGNDRLLFTVFLGGFIAMFILKNTLRYLSVVSLAYFSQRTLHHVRKELFSKYMSFGKLFFDTTNVGHHSALLLEFSQRALHPLATGDRFINSLLSLAAYLGVMLMISWELTLVALPLFVVLYVSVRMLIAWIKSLSGRIKERSAEMNSKSIEILSTIPLVKAYRTEATEQRRYTDISDKKARLDFNEIAVQAAILPLQEIITALVATSILVGTLYLFGRDQVASAPALMVYFYVIMNAANKFGQLSGFRASLASASGSLDAVLSVFDEEGKFFVRGGDRPFTGLTRNIAFRNLTFSYTDRAVLRDVSFTLDKGRMTAIVGPTGAGKSTIISLLMRFYDCPPDSILIDGDDVRSFTLDSYLAHTALVSQETLLLHDSLRNNILYGLQGIDDNMLNEAVDRARLGDFVSKLPQGLDTLIGDRGVRLSGGEKQRVSIARALLKKAEILILDEATSSLDSQTEKLIQEAIDEAVSGRTAIVIAHRLSTIKHADKIVVLEDGTVAEEGTLEDLLARKGVFFGLWEEQKF